MHTSTIIALATPQGKGAIAIIRLSGPQAIDLVNQAFKGKDLTQQPPNTIHFGVLHDGTRVIDEVLVSIFKAPRSFTKEDSVEISCHGSPFIVQQIIEHLVKKGAHPAKPGEFTQRAFLAGQFDLSGAEAVADLIEAETFASHKMALRHMRGKFANELQHLRERLKHCASLLEVSLDFAEEDLTFASHDELTTLVDELLKTVKALVESFHLGNVIKNGVATVIAGKPNVGKSTLLNTLLGEDRALVSDIAGTTRDSIEERIVWGGIAFRFIDTAGLRKSEDKVEAMGISRAHEQIKKANLILYVIDLTKEDIRSLKKKKKELQQMQTPYLLIGNKLDKTTKEVQESFDKEGVILVAAKHHSNIEKLKKAILKTIQAENFCSERTLVANTRHYHRLIKTQEALEAVHKGIIAHLSPELLVLDLRNALHHLGSITGEVTTDEVLSTIFSKFCIGK